MLWRGLSVLIWLVCGSVLAGCPRELPDLVQEALSCNATIQAQGKAISAAQESVAAQWGAFLPKISANAGAFNEHLNSGNDGYIYTNVEARWNLYRGGADVATLDSRRTSLAVTHHAFSQRQKEIANAVATEFFHLLYIDQAIDLYDNFLKTNDGYIDIAKRKRDAGLTTDIDVLEFQITQETLRTEQQLLRQELYQHQQELALLLSCPAQWSELCVAGEFPDLRCLEPCTLYEQALCQRDDRALAALELNLRHDECRRVRANYYPSVDMVASYGKEPDDKDDRGVGTQVLLQASMPLFDGCTTYREQQATRCLFQEKKINNDQLENAIYSEVAVAISRADVAAKRLATTQERHEMVQKYWSMTKDEYSKGTKNSVDLSSATDRLLQNTLDLVTFQRDWALALVDVSRAIGVAYCDFE